MMGRADKRSASMDPLALHVATLGMPAPPPKAHLTTASPEVQSLREEQKYVKLENEKAPQTF
eukprot:3195288-Amphidinium_carterae.1